MNQFVCHREIVTVHELTNSIALDYQSIECSKRSTGFCTPHFQENRGSASCARLLAEHRGMPKRGIGPRPAHHAGSLAQLAGLDPDWG